MEKNYLFTNILYYKKSPDSRKVYSCIFFLNVFVVNALFIHVLGLLNVPFIYFGVDLTDIRSYLFN